MLACLLDQLPMEAVLDTARFIAISRRELILRAYAERNERILLDMHDCGAICLVQDYPVYGQYANTCYLWLPYIENQETWIFWLDIDVRRYVRDILYQHRRPTRRGLFFCRGRTKNKPLYRLGPVAACSSKMRDIWAHDFSSVGHMHRSRLHHCISSL